MLHLSRLAEDWILYSSEEFGWMELGDGVTSGSSLMPQKKNPDSLELIRGKSGRVAGCFHSLMMTIKGLPLTYNRDMQEDKEPLFEAADQLSGSLEMARAVADSVTLGSGQSDAAAAEESWVVATDLAEALARSRNAVPSGASTGGTPGARKRAPGPQARRLDRGGAGKIRSRVHAGDGATARSRRRNEIARSRGRHRAAGRGEGAGRGARAFESDAGMSKSFRHGQIRKLIRAKKIPTQDDFAQELKKLGIAATQVTLSRDIRELGLVKTAGGYKEIAAEAAGLSLETLAGEFLEDVRIAQNQIVLRTAPGHANSVAVALDSEAWPEVVGTLAGDDTILVIAPDSATAETVGKKLLAMVAAER